MLEKKIVKFESGKVGSALIMTVVLTVLLAIVAVMFVMVARMDIASTSNIVDSKTLDNAAKSIVEIIGKELLFDTPGVGGQEYQDYPDPCDAWLANIEPDNGAAEWRQISDVTGYLKDRGFQTQDILVDPPTGSETIKDDVEIKVDEDGQIDKDYYDNTTNKNRATADADGDGIADSKWIEVAGVNSSKGKKVYAAVRVIDNCAMLNVNTAYKFDANSRNDWRIDGTSQLQINLNGLLKSGDDIDDFHKARGGKVPDSRTNWDNYDKDVIWKYDSLSDANYLPFDISDELELRYRYCIDSKFVSRIEADANTTRGAGSNDSGQLYNSDPCWGLGDGALQGWQDRITDANDTPTAERRHLLTTYSFDRLIDPNGDIMRNVRKFGFGSDEAQWLYDNRLIKCIDANGLTGTEVQNMKYYLAQFAANMVDQSDSDSNVSTVIENGIPFYGSEKPYIYISEITRNIKRGVIGMTSYIFRSYAIELFKEFDRPDGNDIFDNWELVISNPLRTIRIDSNDFQSRGGRFYVMIFDGSGPGTDVSLQDDVHYTNTPEDGAKGVDPAVILSWNPFFMGYDPNGDPVLSDKYDFYINGTLELSDTTDKFYDKTSDYTINTTYSWQVVGKKTGFDNIASPVRSFTTWSSKPEDVNSNTRFSDNRFTVSLWRPKDGGYILVDEVNLPRWLTDVNDSNGIGEGKCTFQRDITQGFRIKHIWDWAGVYRAGDSLGRMNGNDPFLDNPIQQRRHNFTTVGDAAMLFAKKSVYLTGSRIGPADTEADVRFDVNSPSMQNVFKYLTALPPYGASTDARGRVHGRININTAPKFVIEQLPWVKKANRQNLKIADAIVAYRDKLDLSSEGGPNYYRDNAANARKLETGINNIYESPGFRSVGELLTVINQSSGKNDYNIRYCGIDNANQYGYPDLTFDSTSMNDGIKDDLEEKELIFARISDLATVRSDTFTAYILVRLGVNGPQKRFMAIFDRSGVDKYNYKVEKVKVAAFQQVPAAR